MPKMNCATDVGSNVHHANIIGQGKARGLWYQNAWCFNWGKHGHLQRDCDQTVKCKKQHWTGKVNKLALGSMTFLNLTQKEGLGFPGCVCDMKNVELGSGIRSKRFKVTSYSQETALGAWLRAQSKNYYPSQSGSIMLQGRKIKIPDIESVVLC